jgi:hypothetical protein
VNLKDVNEKCTTIMNIKMILCEKKVVFFLFFSFLIKSIDLSWRWFNIKKKKSSWNDVLKYFVDNEDWLREWICIVGWTVESMMHIYIYIYWKRNCFIMVHFELVYIYRYVFEREKKERKKDWKQKPSRQTISILLMHSK